MANDTDSLQLRNEELLRENDDLKTQLSEARAANMAKEAFLSSMSHDIRTPMNAIIGLTAVAQKHLDEKGRVADALNKIEIASDHLLNLINEVLDMSRIDSGRLDLASAPFALSDLLHDTLVIVRPQAEQKRHTLRFTLGDILYEGLIGDVTRLRQIFVNIITNAVKYTDEGGEIRVTVSEEMEGDRCALLFACSDNGIGMSGEFLNRMFEPFERAKNTTLSGVEGTGLGMSIVKKLLDAMGGTIAVESEPGKGTDVRIRIPLRYETLALDTSALENAHLLVIEANARRRELFATYLGEFGIRHTMAASPSEAIAALTAASFEGSSFDGAILGTVDAASADIYALAAYLRKSNPALPIILVSKADWDEIKYHANRSGIDWFIPIPFFRKSLLNGLNAALHRTAAEQNSFAAVPDLSGRRVLLVEDNLINQEIAREILTATNAAIDVASDGREGLERFAASSEGAYDLILMDIQMPVMDGYEAARAIRALDRPDAKTVRIFAMTANVFAEDIAKALDAGMNGHIAKPIDINKLMQTLRQFS